MFMQKLLTGQGTNCVRIIVTSFSENIFKMIVSKNVLGMQIKKKTYFKENVT